MLLSTYQIDNCILAENRVAFYNGDNNARFLIGAGHGGGLLVSVTNVSHFSLKVTNSDFLKTM